eukprot:2475830-Pyramimonas_sp.AAC.1
MLLDHLRRQRLGQGVGYVLPRVDLLEYDPSGLDRALKPQVSRHNMLLAAQALARCESDRRRRVPADLYRELS